MTEQQLDTSDQADEADRPAEPGRIRALQWLRDQHGFVAGALVMLMSSVVAVVQELDVPWYWLLLAVALATALAAFVGRATEDRAASEKIRYLWAALVTVVIFLGGVFVYQQIASGAPKTFELVVDTQGAPTTLPYAEPDTFRSRHLRPGGETPGPIATDSCP